MLPVPADGSATCARVAKYDRFVLWLQLGKLHKQASCRSVKGGVSLKRMVHSRHVIESTAKEAQCLTCWGTEAERTDDTVGSNGRRGGGRNAPEVRIPYRPNSPNKHLQEPRTWTNQYPIYNGPTGVTPPTPVVLPPPVAHVSPTPPDKE